MTVTGGAGSLRSREILNRSICGMAGGFEKPSGAFPGIAVFEDGAARDQDLSPRADNVRDCVVMNAAVHFNAELKTARLADFSEQLHFSQG